jgi:hypothetical protein
MDTKINQYSVASQNLSIKWCHHPPTHNQWFYEQNPTVSLQSRRHYNGHHYVGKLKSEHQMLEKWLKMDWRVSIMCQLWHHNKDLRLGNNEPSLFLKLLEHIVSLPLHTWHLQELISIQKDLVFKMLPPSLHFSLEKSDHLPWLFELASMEMLQLLHFIIMEPPPGLLRRSSISTVLYISVIILGTLLQARVNLINLTILYTKNKL